MFRRWDGPPGGGRCRPAPCFQGGEDVLPTRPDVSRHLWHRGSLPRRSPADPPCVSARGPQTCLLHGWLLEAGLPEPHAADGLLVMNVETRV